MSVLQEKKGNSLKNTFYKITVTKWHEHNSIKKNTYKKTLISNNLITDAKINALPTSNKWLFLALLLICGDHANDTITLTERQVNDILTTREGASNALDRLQSFQLVTYEKMPIIKEIKEIKERKRNKRIPIGVEKQKQAEVESCQTTMAIAPDKPDNVGQILFGKYCVLWKQRYNASPPTRPQDTKNLKNFGQANGIEKTSAMLETYFAMPDSFYVQRRHDIQTFLNNVNAIVAFQQSGRVLTKKEVNQFDSMVTNHNTKQALREGKI